MKMGSIVIKKVLIGNVKQLTKYKFKGLFSQICKLTDYKRA